MQNFGPANGRGVGGVPPLSSVGTLHGGAVTGSHAELVPPGRATTSVGAGVSKAVLHQHPHTAGTVVAAGESPATGEYGGVAGGGCTTLKFGEGATASVRGRGVPADSESVGETGVSGGVLADSESAGETGVSGGVPADSESAGETGVSGGVPADTKIIECDKASALSIHRKGGSRPSSLFNTLRGEARRAPPISDGPCSGGTPSLKEGSSVAPTPVPPYEGDTARRIGAGVESSALGAASTRCANPFHGSTQPPLCGVDTAPLHYFCGEQGHQPPSSPSAGQGKGSQHLAALAPTGARVGRAPSGHLSPAKLAALRGDGSFRQSRNPPVIESTVDILTVRAGTDFKAVCTVENLGFDPWQEDMLWVCRRLKEGPNYPAAMAAASSAIEEGCTSLQQLGGRHGTYFSPDDVATIRSFREFLISSLNGIKDG